ncbi:hypothetical protein CFP65_7349 [Kitasatospora sp. MMS16-BH015]|uniref:sensor histidine kinase n=1 Tax=Kitasatospora sp. MMS16-BH015 TaxID=2018025 RepID=UPI000CA3B0BF|nr:histidine kinase [Kitasatospora sp. MMS16-BH015]AUG81933.1 hypothetical protein CFP65_7349 [Kitasatospora sp. MMS16-BH015]
MTPRPTAATPSPQATAPATAPAPSPGLLPWADCSPSRRLAVDAALTALSVTDTVLSFPPGPAGPAFGLSLLTAAVLLARRRLPRAALLAGLPGILTGDAFVSAAVLSYTLARSLVPTWQKLLGTSLVIGTVFLPWPLALLAQTSVDHLTEQLIYSTLLGAGPAALGLLVRTRTELSDRVTELAVLRDQERALHQQTVIAQERARIAREMHDVVAHQASLIAVQAGALEVTAEDSNVRAAAGTLRTLAVATLDDLRELVLAYRAVGDHGPTLADLPTLVDSAGLPVTLDAELPHRLPDHLERTAYRTVQEALTNVRKHAPGAATTVRLRLADGHLLLTVHNTAPPAGLPHPDLPTGGHGLTGLRERAALLGGTLTTAPTTAGGFELHLRLPLSLGA